MLAKVVDASALCALLFGEPEAGTVASSLAGSALFAPELLSFEVANTCLMKRRRHPESGGQLLAGFDQFHRMSVELVRVDLTATLHLAENSGLTVYDASYLWLARQLKAELVTLDRRLREASVR